MATSILALLSTPLGDLLSDKFETFVVRGSNKDSCWGWEGPAPRRYGMVRVGKVALLAHRLSFVAYHGVDDPNLLVCHTCDNPPCTNPRHLWLGTHMDNHTDKVSKGRDYRFERRIGSENATAALTEAEVEEIKILLQLGVTSYKLSKEFSVSQSTLWKIKSGKTWAHVVV